MSAPLQNHNPYMRGCVRSPFSPPYRVRGRLWWEKVRMRGTTFVTLTSILSHQGRGGIRPHLVRHPLRVGLCLVAALAAALVLGCGSESAPQPAPTPTAGRDAVIKAIEDVLSPTAVSVAAPTATASVPAPPSGAGPSARSMAPNFSLSSAGGDEVSLAGLLEDHQAVVIVFYRGFF